MKKVLFNVVLLNLLVYESPTKISKDSGTMALLVDHLHTVLFSEVTLDEIMHPF